MSVLVLDQGGHSTRALVFGAKGAVAAQASVAVETQFPATACVEQNPVAIVNSMQEVLDRVALLLGEAVHTVTEAALIVQRSSLVAWDTGSGLPLSPVLSWQDTRHAAWLEQRIAGREQHFRALTGLFPNPHYGASKIRWLLDHSPAVQTAREHGSLCIGPLASYLHWKLTGAQQAVVDAVIASRTLLTALGELDWSPWLLEFFDIPRTILPVIRPTQCDYGLLKLGDATVPLHLLGGDQSFVALSHAGWQQSGTVFINAGTGVFVQQLMPATRVPLRLLSSALALGGGDEKLFVAEGTVNAAASALDWLWSRLGYAFSEADWQQADKTAQENPATVPVFCNRIAASGSPDWLPAGESFFTTQANVHQQAIAVLESIVFAVQRNLDCLAVVESCSRIVLSGGLSRLPLFCQRLASLAGTAVWCGDDAEASARGAAMQLSVDVAGEQCYECFKPVPDEGLQARYAQWSALMDSHAVAG